MTEPSRQWIVFSDRSAKTPRGRYEDPPDEAERSGDGTWATLYGEWEDAGSPLPITGPVKVWMRTTEPRANLTRQPQTTEGQ